MKLFNTLSRKVEELAPLNDPDVRLYTCGPTVYNYMTIGNWRKFVFDDLLSRSLKYQGYKVNHVMNVTDVGHLSGDNLGHADTGEDRLEKGAKREGKTVWEVAQFYLDAFLKDREDLGILPPTHLPRATDHIKQQIALVQTLIDKGYAYETETGVFFEIDKFPSYGKLGGQKLVDKRVASREEVEEDPTKKNPLDFALWLKRVGKFADHSMHWDSPWGDGFPGWHIECSAMAMEYLGETLDIHTGGVDHIAIHHANEIAQSEAATDKPFSQFWMHSEFLTVDGGRMGKSLGNAYIVDDIKTKGFEPLALRYFYLSAHYRTVLNFTWEGLQAAQNALTKLRRKVASLDKDDKTGGDVDNQADSYRQEFDQALSDDLNFPQALAVVWKLVDDANISVSDKKDALLKFDEVLGLDLTKAESKKEVGMTNETKELLIKREQLRKEKNYEEADKIRDQLLAKGIIIEDS